MNQVIVISLFLMVASLTNVYGVTPTLTTYCPSGMYTGFTSTALLNKAFPITTIAGVSYTSSGFYGATSAEQCCYNCATQTDGACTTWTYDSCGRCYLSSAKLTTFLIYFLLISHHFETI